ncbi:MAG: hypothetical protein EXR77_09385 [Myxococcales bacterium]|nr:hypothetical protein [Myxococcales bacterium]
MVSGVKNPANPCLTCQPTVTQNQWTLLASCKCAGGTCCDAGVVKPVNSSCGTTKLATEYGCSADSKATTSRVALAGCTGGQAICSSASTFYAWQPWISAACKADELCENTDKTLASTCKVADPLCTQADSYEAGTTLAKAHDLGIFVDSAAAKALTPLLLLSSPTDVDVLKWNVIDGANTFAPALGATWSSAQPVKVCLYAACTGGVNAKDCQALTCPAGTVAAASASVSAATPNGCCSTGTKGSVALSPKPASGAGLGLVGYLEVTNNSTGCTQLAVTLTFGSATAPACKAGVEPCCEAGGAYSAQAKACGSLTLASEYKCDSNLAGGKVLVRKAVSGCTGTSTTCSAATANYAWGAYTTYKACLASELCSVTTTSVAGTCKPATECVADSQCCTSAGKFASTGSACGKSSATEYQCSGANVQIRKQFSTCGGTSTSCFGTAQWSAWTTVAACATGETCTAGATKATLPTCKAAAPDLCKLVDKWESVEATAASLDLGIYSDSAPAIYIDPKVLLQTATDKDFFQYAITDDTNLYDPQVYVSWVAAKPVTVCAYYRCSTGANGKNCADISCPFGSDSFVNTAVSGSAVNGCCKTGASGTLSYYPDAPGLDETGTAFVDIKNGDPSCQQVAIKIGFGASTVTKCDPGNTCCSGKGTYAVSGTECGSPIKFQYRCATASGISQIQKQAGLGTCNGTSTSCSTTTLTWGSFALDQPCLSPEFCAVGLPTGTAACIAGKTGSCAGFCGGKSKDGCQCDGACATFGDCCKDFAAKCSGTCDGSCGGLGKIGGCFCDALCVENGDCCLDKASKCP